jgi:WXG100 family type VII secretion target
MFLQFLRGEVENVSAGVGQQQQITSQVLDQLKSYVPKVQSAWIGGDADKFAEDVASILVPAMMDLIAAIGGVNTNLSSATSIVDQADQKCQGMANQLGDLFGGI